MLGETEQVHIKGAKDPVPARRLLGMATSRRPRSEQSRLSSGGSGRWARSTVFFERSINGNGSVVGLVGPPGIGKSRIVRELTSRAKDAGAEVFATYCESHTTELPFHAAAGLLRRRTGFERTGRRRRPGAGARAIFRMQTTKTCFCWTTCWVSAIPMSPLPQIDPDARRRRLAAMVKAAAIARTTPTVYVIEDAHWIDEISESMLAEFLTVVPRTRSLGRDHIPARNTLARLLMRRGRRR